MHPYRASCDISESGVWGGCSEFDDREMSDNLKAKIFDIFIVLLLP